MDKNLVKQLPVSPGGRMGKAAGVVRRHGWRGYTDTYHNHQYTPNPLPAHALHQEINDFIKDLFPGIDFVLLKKQAK